jgi:hypothetical protein
MELFDSIIALAIVASAALYLYRKFAKSNKGGGCGCSSESGCCGKGGGESHSHCGGHMQHH